ncbi:MAG: hypothetical protein ACYSTX_05910, partial [Planctomycetota bacterium]
MKEEDIISSKEEARQIKQKFYLKSWARKIVFVFLLLIAYPIVNLILNPDNIKDIGFISFTFVPGAIISVIHLIVSFLLWLFLRKKAKVFLWLDVAIFVILLIGLCTPMLSLHYYLSRHNEEIDTEIRNEIHALNDTIIESIRNNEPSVMHNLFVEEVKKTQDLDGTKQFYSQFAPEIANKVFKIYHEYYIVSH